eukprot:gene5694-7860_t
MSIGRNYLGLLTLCSYVWSLRWNLVNNNSKQFESLSHKLNIVEDRNIALNIGQEKILYVDNDIIVVNKPHNIQTVPGFVSNISLAGHIQDLFKISRIDHMIAHRLDYATSGVLIFARNLESLKGLHKQFRAKHPFGVHKIYCAVVDGRMPSYQGEINLALGKDIDRGSPYCKVDTLFGKPSFTEWRVLAQSKSNSLLELRPHTGRTHQLRIHTAVIGHPILGDNFYASESLISKSDRLLLHAKEIYFLHPRTNIGMKFVAEVPFSLLDYD